MALFDSYKNWRIPVRETDLLMLETVYVSVVDEDALEDMVGAISLAKKTDAPSVDLLSNNETATATARRNFCALVGEKHADDLDLILTYYATRKKFFADVVLLGSPEALELDRVGKRAKALQDSLTHLDKRQLLPLTELSTEHHGQLMNQLGVLQQKNGSRKNDLPDLDGALAVALIEWWQNVVLQDAKFWLIKDPRSAEASASSFLRFVSAALGALPSHLRPTETRGSPGFARNAMRRRHKSMTKDEQRQARFVAWLRSEMPGTVQSD
jgi:hypothetical protein